MHQTTCNQALTGAKVVYRLLHIMMQQAIGQPPVATPEQPDNTYDEPMSETHS
jgi:hypothetical protein